MFITLAPDTRHAGVQRFFDLMTFRLDGKKLAGEVEERLNQAISSNIQKVGRPPGLAVIRVGDDPASEVYVSNKERACSRVGVATFGSHFPKTISSQELINEIHSLNANQLVDGILIQLPLPNGFDEEPLLKAIDPEKDVDGLHALNLGRLLKGEPGPRSCTPAGVMALLKCNQIDIAGKKAVVVGRSILVGKPMALMLQAADATVSVAHSKTKDLVALTTQADLLIVAAGRPQMIGPEHIRPNAVVVDVGIHRIPTNQSENNSKKFKLCGDVRIEEIEPLVSAFTPVPGGVGPMTVSMLLVNTVNAWQKHCGLSFSFADLLP